MADRFITGAREWSRTDDGRKWSKWHAYWLPGSATHAVADLYAEALHAEFGEYFAVQEASWRHATIGAVTDRPTWEITDQQHTDLRGELLDAVAQVEPFVVHCGPVWINQVSVILDVRPDASFQRLQEAVETAITRVLGEGAAYDWRGAGRPHLAVAYATGPWIDSGKVASLLRKVTDQVATDIVNRVHLLDVTQDAEASQYTWSDSLEVLHLGTA